MSNGGCDDQNCGCHSGMPRRDFLRITGATAAGAALGLPLRMAKQASHSEFENLVPANKKLSREWIKSLTARGKRSTYRGKDLRFIGMPIGGICAGQVYLGGDGRLWLWDIFNDIKFGVVDKKTTYLGREINAGGGANYVDPPEQIHPFEQGFAIQVDGKTRKLDHTGWAEVAFTGEYPIGFVEYSDPACPISVSLESFSPYIPLNTDESTLPATVMRFTLKNHSDKEQRCHIGGWLENPVGIKTFKEGEGTPRNRIVNDVLVCSLDTVHTDRSDCGDFAMGLLGAVDHMETALPGPDYAGLLLENSLHPTEETGRQVGGLSREVVLPAGKEHTAVFVLAWRFPNLKLPVLGDVGHQYATRFRSAHDVVRHVSDNFAKLYRDTKLWHDTWYDSTLPYWFLDRVQGNTATLATMTCVRFANGRFYGWEGIGCCEGTCGHVWQYAQAMARQFPDLERSVREMVDFGTAFHADTGMIEFRGEYGNGYAADAQSAYVLRTLREHQMSADSAFLKRVWPKAKKALEFLISQDTDKDGVLKNAQHNTLDVNLYGPSSWLSSLYIAALRAGEEMAIEMDDKEFAAQCRSLFEKGKKRLIELVWDGQYFVQRADFSKEDALRYDDGCEIDQVMGQWWAHQVGLGRVIDPDHSKRALHALYRNNFLPDVGPYRDKFKDGRWYATPGEAGTVICTFPKGDRQKILGNKPTWASMYFNECMTGFEYQAAGHMVQEGMVEEGMALTRAVHDRYSATKRNPWNEVECSDHYARCMSVYAVFLAASGFEYHGPKGHIGFAPKISPDHFRSAFTAAEGWGTYEQKAGDESFEVSITVRWGRLRIERVNLELPSDADFSRVQASLNGKQVGVSLESNGRRRSVVLRDLAIVDQGDGLRINLS
ncbi:MAG TPA: GH116 family glycosyl hydrolase [Fimbriimonas sp.]|nr:GH116 family glycosyl hydrolase [Fimbriimonas sp.]